MAEAVNPLGKWWSYVPAALAISAIVLTKSNARSDQRIAAAAAVLLSAAISALVNPALDKLMPQPPPPPKRNPPRPSFPSGHTFGLGALALTTAYILLRHDLIHPAAAAPLAILPPLIGGTGKMVEEKHWPSEVAGGLLVAATIAGSSLAIYELLDGSSRDRSSPQ